MIVSLIVAVSENNAIGKDNQLLWHLPADLKFFKETTSGHTIIMGRKTYESIGRPLPKRRNIVITRSTELDIEGAEVVNSLQSAIALCGDEEEVFVIGGAEIYNHAFGLANCIYLTRVHASYDADTFFPEIDNEDWEVRSSESHQADEKNGVACTFLKLQRK